LVLSCASSTSARFSIGERRVVHQHLVGHAAHRVDVEARVERAAEICSGGMYCGVPAIGPPPSRRASRIAATPKSTIFTMSRRPS
jgi:hypothetical protein